MGIPLLNLLLLPLYLNLLLSQESHNFTRKLKFSKLLLNFDLHQIIPLFLGVVFLLSGVVTLK